MPASPSPEHDDTNAEILRAAAALGVLSGGGHAAPRILAQLCDPEIRAAEIAALIDREPGLSLRVLRVANSAYYGLARKVSTVDRALVILGLDAVRGIAAAACLDRTVMRAGETAPIDLDALVRHSLGTALAAEALARVRHRALAPEAFIAGLLHNLGVMVQLRLDPGGVGALIEVLRMAPQRDLSVLEAERVSVGHERCAAVLFEAWQLPEALVDAARHHHDPLRAPEPHRELAALVNSGIHLSLVCGNTYALEPAAGPPDDAAMALLGLCNAHLEHVTAELPARLAQLRHAFAAA
jgi:HD-like signal output (HDOD) protein